jgi:hypothetical protein
MFLPVVIGLTNCGRGLAGTNSLSSQPSSQTHAQAGFAYVVTEIPSSAHDPGLGSAAFAVNPSTGALTAIDPSPSFGGVLAFAAHPSGKFIYGIGSGVQQGNPDVEVFEVDSTTGLLTTVGSEVTGLQHTSVTVDPLGRFLYASGSGGSWRIRSAIPATFRP